MSFNYRETGEFEIRDAYGPKLRVETSPVGASRTKQQFRDEVNVNNIMETYKKTGVIRSLNAKDPKYGFVPTIDFHEAMNQISLANESFGMLPAEIRKKFNNDPYELVQFINNEANQDEAISLGLLPDVELRNEEVSEKAVVQPDEPGESASEST